MTRLNNILLGALFVAISLGAHAERTAQETEELVSNVLDNMTTTDKFDYIHTSGGYLLPPLDSFGSSESGYSK